MQIAKKLINIQNKTLNTLLVELKDECQKVITLIHQLQLADLDENQQGAILSELLVSSIHLNTHCDQDWQDLISDEIQNLNGDLGSSELD
jgi:hypothetical protein